MCPGLAEPNSPLVCISADQCLKYCDDTLSVAMPHTEHGIAPRAARRYAPADGSSTVAKIAADLRPSADGSAVRTSLVAGGG